MGQLVGTRQSQAVEAGAHDDVGLAASDAQAKQGATVAEGDPASSSKQASKEMQTSNHLQIRRGLETDREGVRALMRQHHANSLFRAQAFADWKFDAQFDHLVQHQKNTLRLVADYRGSIVGALWAVCDQYMLSDGPPFVSVQLIAVEQEAIDAIGRSKTFLGLVKAVRQWTIAQSASHAQIQVTTGTNLEATDKLLKAAGAKCVGGSYVI